MTSVVEATADTNDRNVVKASNNVAAPWHSSVNETMVDAFAAIHLHWHLKFDCNERRCAELTLSSLTTEQDVNNVGSFRTVPLPNGNHVVDDHQKVRNLLERARKWSGEGPNKGQTIAAREGERWTGSLLDEALGNELEHRNALWRDDGRGRVGIRAQQFCNRHAAV